MYVTFKSIEFHNYKSIKKGSLVLDDRGVILIKGENNDKTGSNGAGKSTIANGLLWCLFDRTLTGKESENEIVPKFIPKKVINKEGCSVTVTVLREDIEYCITRYRKHPDNRNTVSLKKRIGDTFENLSRCVDKETNELIVDIIGADFDSFVHSNVFSFNNIEPFLGRSDKDKKELILPTPFIEKFRGAYKNTTAKIKLIEFDLQRLSDDVIVANVECSEKSSQLKEVEAEIIEYNKQVEEIKKQIKIEENKRNQLKIKAPVLLKAQSDVQLLLKNLTEQLNTISNSISLCREKQTKYSSLLNEKLRFEKALSETQLKISEFKNDSSDLAVQKLAELNEDVIANTDICNHLESQMSELGVSLKKEEQLLTNISNIKDKLNAKISEAKIDKDCVERNIIQADSVIRQLNQQKDAVLTKYFSKECQTCPHNKINEVLKDIEMSIKIQTKSFIESKDTLKLIQTKIKELEDKKPELEEYATKTKAKINTITQESLIPLQNNLLISSSKLQDLKAAVMIAQSKLEASQARLEEISKTQITKTNLDKSIKDILIKINEVGDPTAIETELTNLLEREQQLKYNLSMQQAKEKEITNASYELEYSIKDIERTIENLSFQTVPPTNLIAKRSSLKESLGSLSRQIELIKDEKKSKFEKHEILKFWKVGFSSAGVEGFMLDSILNSMNLLVGKYLGYLSSNTISLTLLPDKSLKSGETRNKISECVENDSGGPTYKSNSSGERRIMDIAVLFALKYIYEQITKTKYNLVFMDEVFDSLDASTCSKVITLLHSMEDINSIFVVSHSESIALEFESFITATKTKGITELS
jgi:DNA repair exonuclease SbcCD ATPase subunit